MTFILLLAAAALVNDVIGDEELRITSVDDFIEFKDNVNKGNNYLGTTVFLDSDLSLAGKTFEPIGTSSNRFLGIFDGQGHVISNLAMNSPLQEVGLFGYSKKLTIKNVILGSSCSIASSYGSGDAYIGGIIGWCSADNGPCTIENCVNMGRISFSGTINNNVLYLGGIAGEISSYNYDSTVKNCADYGGVIHSGTSKNSCIGGIVGYSYASSLSNIVYVYNSISHGTITHSGSTSDDLHLGGVAGFAFTTTIENCVSGGEILMYTLPTYNYIGSIVGYVGSDTSINNAYFTSDLSDYKKYGSGTQPSESNTLSYDSTSFELNETVSIGSYTGTSLIEALNAATNYNSLRDYSHWLLNKENNAVTFTINKNSPFTLNTQVILLPSLVSEGNMSFDGWYTDDGLTTPLTSFEVTSETELYGRYCGLPKYTVTLDVNGGDELAVKEMTIGCNRVYGVLPNPTRTEATFLGWFTGKTDGDKIESRDNVTILNNHTLYAHWSINKYTLTFVFGNETEPEVRVLEFNEAIAYPAEPVRAGYSFISWDRNITNMPADNTTIITALWTANNYTVTFNPSGGSISQLMKVVTFDSTYGELPTPNMTGSSFIGWLTEKNESITEGSIVKIPNNHTLYADWKEVTQSQVEIVFSTKDMAKEEIEAVIKKYTDAEFTISVIENNEDEVRVIVEFVDSEKANEFVRKVNTAPETEKEDDQIKRVGSSSENPHGNSFSPAHHPMSLLYLI